MLFICWNCQRLPDGSANTTMLDRYGGFLKIGVPMGTPKVSYRGTPTYGNPYGSMKNGPHFPEAPGISASTLCVVQDGHLDIQQMNIFDE